MPPEHVPGAMWRWRCGGVLWSVGECCGVLGSVGECWGVLLSVGECVVACDG